MLGSLPQARKSAWLPPSGGMPSCAKWHKNHSDGRLGSFCLGSLGVWTTPQFSGNHRQIPLLVDGGFPTRHAEPQTELVCLGHRLYFADARSNPVNHPCGCPPFEALALEVSTRRRRHQLARVSPLLDRQVLPLLKHIHKRNQQVSSGW